MNDIIRSKNKMKIITGKWHWVHGYITLKENYFVYEVYNIGLRG